MLDARVFARAARGWRLVALLMGTMTMIAGHLAWDAQRRNVALSNDVGELRMRLIEKRDVIVRQRQEMSEVAMAVDRLARTTTVLRERATVARRLAHMEETRDQQSFVVPASFGGGMSIVSEDAAHALEELAWLDGQAANASDSIAVLTAVLRAPRAEASYGVPTAWPVHGLVTSPFGARMSPWGEGTETHPGIDISAHYGQPVGAAGPGEVVFAGRDGGYGGLVVIDHGGRLNTLYGHLSALYVRPGQLVRRGQPVGAVGATGRATGAHLHYEVRVNGSPVDPNRYLAQASTAPRVRRAVHRTVSRTVSRTVTWQRRS
jgi:murein DD-endopeptidase MepM/ murein hydrolase activator NlpD